jgi:hypothetical protein
VNIRQPVDLGAEEVERWDDLESRIRPHADHVIRERRHLVASAPERPEGRPGA